MQIKRVLWTICAKGTRYVKNRSRSIKTVLVELWKTCSHRLGQVRIFFFIFLSFWLSLHSSFFIIYFIIFIFLIIFLSFFHHFSSFLLLVVQKKFQEMENYNFPRVFSFFIIFFSCFFHFFHFIIIFHHFLSFCINSTTGKKNDKKMIKMKKTWKKMKKTRKIAIFYFLENCNVPRFVFHFFIICLSFFFICLSLFYHFSSCFIIFHQFHHWKQKWWKND